MNLPHMIPYAEPYYFLMLGFALAPIIFSLLFFQKRLTIYQAVVTCFFLFISFGGTYWQQGLALIGYVVWQSILVWCYFTYRKKVIKVFGFIWR